MTAPTVSALPTTQNPLVQDCLKLGFGMMRLPKLPDGQIDVQTTSSMVDDFIAAGGKYFDTAFVYSGSEQAVGKALCQRYPRDAYYLASKLNAGTWAAKSEAEAKAQTRISLDRCGAGYFDFYLLHAISKDNINYYDKYAIWDYVRSLKRDGLIKHYGFSFHDSPQLLDKVLTDHPDVEFVQLQINYTDWDDPQVQSRANYQVATSHGVPVIVMEPVKGGTLATPPDRVASVLHAANPKASYPSWAIRFVASLPNVMMVLSGMSAPDQMADNLSFMRDFQPLSPQEQATIDQARQVFNAIDRIGCTACHYCTGGCPVQMQIPDIFKVMNAYKLYENLDKAQESYQKLEGSRASACLQCGQCESACPQHLPIIELLQEVAQALE